MPSTFRLCSLGPAARRRVGSILNGEMRRRQLLLLELAILELYTIMHQIQALIRGESQCLNTSVSSCLLGHVIHSPTHQTRAGYALDGGNSPSEPERDNKRHTSIVERVESSCLIIKVALRWQISTAATATIIVRSHVEELE
jgi:hypothetical protein